MAEEFTTDILICGAGAAGLALAIDLARSAGLCLVGFAREEGFNVYTHPERLQGNGLHGHPPA